MSKNLFKKNNFANNLRKTTNIEIKNHGRDIFNPSINDKSSPITIITKHKAKDNNKDNNKEESSTEQKSSKTSKDVKKLDKEKRNFSKKAKVTPNHDLNTKKVKTEIKKNNNIENKNNENEYQIKIEKKLREKSFSKNEYRKKKKEKNNDFLRCGINMIDIEDIDLKDNEKTKNEQNNINLINNNSKYENSKNNMINIENNIKKLHMANIGNSLKINDEKINKNKNNEASKINEKDIEKGTNIKYYSNKHLYRSLNNNSEGTQKRSVAKKHTFQSQKVLKDIKITTPFSFDRRSSLRNSSNKESSSPSIRKSSSLRKSINNINNIIIPLLNRTKENNCFLNVIIQSLFHCSEFKKDLTEKNSNLSNNSRTLKELINVLTSYGSEQNKNKDNKGQIEPVLSVNDLKYYLNNIYKCYPPGETGDPMETLGHIFDLIHKIYCKKRQKDYKKIENCTCPSHQYFLLKLVDIISCPFCNVKKVQMYNNDCFMFTIYIKEIINKLHGKNINSYKYKLFSKLKDYNETYDNENKTKIPGCTCNSKRMQSYEKKLKLNGPSSNYLIINISWAEEFPRMIEILTTYLLIPMSESIENLFTYAEDIKPKINDVYYIKSIILYGLYHYVCALYIRDQKRWAIIDDKTIKYINKYSDLVDSMLRNHLMPVGIIFSKDRNDSISESEMKLHSISKEELKKLNQFCKDVDSRRGLKVSDLFTSKGSFNDNNQNYLNNNYFYNSIIDILPLNENDNNKQNLFNNVSISGQKENDNMNQKNHIVPNNLINKDNNDSNKNLNIFNIDNNTKYIQKNDKDEFLKGRKYYGNFSENNLKGGILLFSSSSLNNGNNEKKTTNGENNLVGLGLNYEDN